MSTITKDPAVSPYMRHEAQHTSRLSRFWENAEYNRFGIMPILIAVIGCMGGFAASFGAGADTLKIALVAFPTVISLALTLAVAPMKLIAWTSAIAIVVDLAVLIF